MDIPINLFELVQGVRELLLSLVDFSVNNKSKLEIRSELPDARFNKLARYVIKQDIEKHNIE